MEGEAALIRALLDEVPTTTAELLLGPGDDGAVLGLSGPLVVVQDQLISGRHFHPDWGAPEAAGWKLLARNLADLAAMGATPSVGFVSLALPPGAAGAAVSLYRGIGCLARQVGVTIGGGDTSTTTGPLAASMTLIGRIEGRPLLRSNAAPGDDIWLSGPTGLSAAGLALLEHTRIGGGGLPPELSKCVDQQLRPVARLRLGGLLAATGEQVAAIDLSDGLARDAARVAASSGVGLSLHLDDLPCSDTRAAAAKWLRPSGGAAQLDHHWQQHGGEDHELLFTAPPGLRPRLQAWAQGDCPGLTCVGQVIPAEADMPSVWSLREDGKREALVWKEDVRL